MQLTHGLNPPTRGVVFAQVKRSSSLSTTISSCPPAPTSGTCFPTTLVFEQPNTPGISSTCVLAGSRGMMVSV